MQGPNGSLPTPHILRRILAMAHRPSCIRRGSSILGDSPKNVWKIPQRSYRSQESPCLNSMFPHHSRAVPTLLKPNDRIYSRIAVYASLFKLGCSKLAVDSRSVAGRATSLTPRLRG